MAIPAEVVRLELNSFADLGADAADLAIWTAKAHATVIEPIVDAARRAQPAVAEGSRQSDWGAAGQIGSFLGPWMYGHREPRLAEYTQSSWQQALAQLGSGRLRGLNLSIRMLGREAVPEPDLPGLSFRIDDWGVEFEGRPWQIALAFSRTFLSDDELRRMSASLGRLLSEGARASRAAYGYLTVDRTGAETAYELEVGRPGFNQGMPEAGEWLRGYFWGNVLTRRHTDRLGGRDHILAAAPCSVVEEIDEERLYLQLTSELTDFPDGALRALKVFFGPALPPGRPGYIYRGPAVRIA